MKVDQKFDEAYFKRSNLLYPTYKDTKLMKTVYFPKCVIGEGISRNSRVLDIGCGFGYFLRLCDDYELKTYGLDISEYAVEKAKAITKAKLYLYDANKGLKIFQNGFFDLVTAFDVIEHLRNPSHFLREVFRVINVGGKLILTTPNLNAITRIWEKSKWYGYTDYTHIRLFDPASLRFLVRDAGMRLIREETPFHTFPKVIQKITNRFGIGGQIWLVCQKLN